MEGRRSRDIDQMITAIAIAGTVGVLTILGLIGYAVYSVITWMI